MMELKFVRLLPCRPFVFYLLILFPFNPLLDCHCSCQVIYDEKAFSLKARRLSWVCITKWRASSPHDRSMNFCMSFCRKKSTAITQNARNKVNLDWDGVPGNLTLCCRLWVEDNDGFPTHVCGRPRVIGLCVLGRNASFCWVSLCWVW